MTTSPHPDEERSAIDERSGTLAGPLPGAVSAEPAPGAPPDTQDDLDDYDADDWRPDDAAREAGRHPATED